jgi:hypothetical protein
LELKISLLINFFVKLDIASTSFPLNVTILISCGFNGTAPWFKREKISYFIFGLELLSIDIIFKVLF